VRRGSVRVVTFEAGIWGPHGPARALCAVDWRRSRACVRGFDPFCRTVLTRTGAPHLALQSDPTCRALLMQKAALRRPCR
jgi:hypothetical protein